MECTIKKTFQVNQQIYMYIKKIPHHFPNPRPRPLHQTIPLPSTFSRTRSITSTPPPHSPHQHINPNPTPPHPRNAKTEARKGKDRLHYQNTQENIYQAGTHLQYMFVQQTPPPTNLMPPPEKAEIPFLAAVAASSAILFARRGRKGWLAGWLGF